jgi:hypothetical protein
MRNTRQTFDFTVKQRQQRFRRLVAVGKTGAAGNQHHLHLIAGNPRRHLGANGVAVLFHNRLIDDDVARLLAASRSQWPEVSSSSPRRLETVRIAIRVGINSALAWLI